MRGVATCAPVAASEPPSMSVLSRGCGGVRCVGAGASLSHAAEQIDRPLD